MKKKGNHPPTFFHTSGIVWILFSFLFLFPGCHDTGAPDPSSKPDFPTSPTKPGVSEEPETPDQWPAVSLFHKTLLVECNDNDILKGVSAVMENHLRPYIQPFLSHEVRRELDIHKIRSAPGRFDPYLISLQRLSPSDSRPVKMEISVQSQLQDVPDLDPIITEVSLSEAPDWPRAGAAEFSPVLSAVLELMTQDILRSNVGFDERRSLYELYCKADPDSWEKEAVKRGLEKMAYLPLDKQYLEFYIESLPGDSAFAEAITYQVPAYLKSRLKRIIAKLAQGGVMKGSPQAMSIQIQYDRVINKLENTPYSKVVRGHYSPGTVEGRLMLGNVTTGNSQVISHAEKQPLPGAIRQKDLDAQEQAFRDTEELIFKKLVRNWVLQLFERSLSNNNVPFIPILLDMCDGPLLDKEEKTRIAALLKRVQLLEKGHYYLILGLRTIGINRALKIQEVYDLIGDGAVSIWMNMYRLLPEDRRQAMTRIISMKRKGNLDDWTELKPFAAEIAENMSELTDKLSQSGLSRPNTHDSNRLRAGLIFLFLCEHQGDDRFTESIRYLDAIGFEATDSEIRKLYSRVLSR